MRILIAGVVGGLAMFIWAAIGHDLLPLGSVGMKTIPNEAPVLAAMQGSIGDKSGIYMFPAASMHGATAPGPGGFMVYSAKPTVMTPSVLGLEAGSEIVQALLLALVLSSLALTGVWQRVGIAAAVGAAAAMCTSASYWIWYHFPTDYTLGYMFVDWVRFVVAGLVIALILRTKPAAT